MSGCLFNRVLATLLLQEIQHSGIKTNPVPAPGTSAKHDEHVSAAVDLLYVSSEPEPWVNEDKA